MKISRILIVTVTMLIIAYGWVSFIGSKSSAADEYNENIRQANQWYEDGLYQRAIEKYELAIEYNNSEENWDKMFKAYKSRLKEDFVIYVSYADALSLAMKVYPKNANYVEQLVDLYMDKARYQQAYDLIIEAEQSGTTSRLLESNKLVCGYQYKIRSFEYQSFLPFSGGLYSVLKRDLYMTIELDGATGKLEDFVYLSRFNDDGVHIRTDENGSRLIDGEGVVLGIFDFRVEDCGLFADGLIPVFSDGTYAYYDSFAVKQFGEYEQAGTFQDGKAAVKQDGMWGIIDTTGSFVTESRYTDIVLDRNGYYLYDDIIVASDGTYYTFYDSKWEIISSFTCDLIDCYSGMDLFAFMRDGKWGFVTSKGEVIIEPEYDGAKSFSNGVAAVKKDGKWGFVSRDNQVTIDFIFDDADYFNEKGACMVRMPSSKDETVSVWKIIIWTVEWDRLV